MTVALFASAPATLTTSAVAYVTAGSGEKRRVTFCNLVNYSGGAVTWTAYRVPSGGAAADGNKLASAKSIATLASDQAPEVVGLILNAGETLQILASAGSAITLNVAGQVIS